jgi:EAL domain-containing protein (putative c-di-GMP-specific phosphodiesterase class I)
MTAAAVAREKAKFMSEFKRQGLDHQNDDFLLSNQCSELRTLRERCNPLPLWINMILQICAGLQLWESDPRIKELEELQDSLQQKENRGCLEDDEALKDAEVLRQRVSELEDLLSCTFTVDQEDTVELLAEIQNACGLAKQLQVCI